MEKIESVQTICIKTILDQPTFVQNSVLLDTTGLITIQSLIKKHSLASFYRYSVSQFNHLRDLGRSASPTPNNKFKTKKRGANSTPPLESNLTSTQPTKRPQPTGGRPANTHIFHCGTGDFSNGASATP